MILTLTNVTTTHMDENAENLLVQNLGINHLAVTKPWFTSSLITRCMVPKYLIPECLINIRLTKNWFKSTGIAMPATARANMRKNETEQKRKFNQWPRYRHYFFMY